MGNKFTQTAERALNATASLAMSFGHTYIGTEHILMALVSDDFSSAAIVLKKHSITAIAVKKAIEDYSGTGERTALTARDMTPKARKIIEGAYAAALKYGTGIIGTEHLLLSLLDERDSVAIKLLRHLGADTASLKEELVNLIRAKEKNAARIKDSSLNYLRQYGKNLIELAREDRFDPVVGRERETDRIIRVLCRKNKNNPCLIGEAGVGKTAIVEGLAKRISEGNVPASLKDKLIISVDLTSMVAGAKYRGDFEERIKNIVNEAMRSRNVILFIDEIHTIVGAGAAEGAIDAANILKPQLSRGDIQIIGATTVREYHKYIEKDPALERRFQPILIDEPSEDDTVRMIEGVKSRYEEHHGVRISDEAIRECVRLTVKYMSDRFLPDKALDIIDEACSLVASESNSECAVYDAENLLDDLIKRRMTALREQDFEEALEVRRLEEKARRELTSIALSDNDADGRQSVEVEDVKRIISEVCKVPITSVRSSCDYEEIADSLRKEIVGQNEAIERIVNALKRRDSGLDNEDRPRGVFLFIGESGVGKTALSNALCRALFNSDSSLLRYDMSEFSERHSVSRLIGSPPGYVGHDDGGSLTEAVRRKPYSVVLFDEIEKADREVRNLFLQIADYGFLTDSSGRRVNFRNTIVIMTSNAGASELARSRGVGFVESESSTKVDSVLKRYFSEEFLGRFDEIIRFSSLGDDEMKRIASRRLVEISQRLSNNGIVLEYDGALIDFISKAAVRRGFGARAILRYICANIEAPLADIIISKNEDAPLRVRLYLDGDEIALCTEEASVNKDLPL
ncbi:MAG: ATP-dependent Clp protease ATP-binding subunit [Clostridia bacterium]|nr:ATP-dependent Clp protease ATP-binding subunit [Clostridia bacterium]